MWILVSAVVSASLLGSLHCVGMCGPLAIWASGAGEGRGRWQLITPTALYHLGRLLTYALAGLLAGAAGQILDLSGQAFGLQLMAARIVGAVMILIGAVRLAQFLRPLSLLGKDSWLGRIDSPARVGPASSRPSLITRALVRMRPLVFKLPVPARGLVTGLLTALLPCGWLYLFALVAAGTGSLITGPLVMAAFWLGSVPALVGLVTGTQLLAAKFRRVVPAAVAVLLIAGGCYTAWGRGFAQLNSLVGIQLPTADNLSSETMGATASHSERLATGIEELTKTPLPCCVDLGLSDPAERPGIKAP